ILDRASRCMALETRDGLIEFEHEGTHVRRQRFPDGTEQTFQWHNDWVAGGTNASTTIRRDFDGLDRIASEATAGWEAAVEYDPNGRLRRIVDSTGRALELRQDGRGRIVQIDDSRMGVHRFEFNPADGATRWLSDLGIRVEFTYDAFGRRNSATAFDRRGQ